MSAGTTNGARRPLARLASRAVRGLRAGAARRHPAGSLVRFRAYTVRINDWPNFRAMARDIFRRRIYDFEARSDRPRILDCGANIGIATLFFKQRYPSARIVAFEPDPGVFPLLSENLTRNGLLDVEAVQAALAPEDGTLAFYADGKYGSCLADAVRGTPPAGSSLEQVRAVRLCTFLDEPVDFVKLNVEGAEWDVLADCADRLRMVREMVIEYHHLPGLPRTLHRLLTLLDDQGFEYLLNDLDAAANPEVAPPFRLAADTRYFQLVYARRLD